MTKVILVPQPRELAQYGACAGCVGGIHGSKKCWELDACCVTRGHESIFVIDEVSDDD